MDSYGYDDVDVAGYQLIEGSVEAQAISNVASLDEQTVLSYLRRGIIALRIKEIGVDKDSNLYGWPLLLFSQSTFFPTKTIDLGGTANFFVGDAQGNLKYAIVNGYLVDLTKEELPQVKNLIF
jgi:hypothetical protein